MTIGPDILEVLAEVGVKFEIQRTPVNIEEYMTYKPNTQATKPFIREFFLEAVFSYETAAVSGDIIYVEAFGSYYLAVNVTPGAFENTKIKNDAVIYKCNVLASVLTPVATANTQTYRTNIAWVPTVTNEHCLITMPTYGDTMLEEEAFTISDSIVSEMYAPSSWGVKKMDRVSLSPSEYYMVTGVVKRRFEGVDLIALGEDKR